MGMFDNVSALLSRLRFAQRLGIQHSGARDLYDVFGYNKCPSHQDYVLKFLRQDIAQRVVNAPVDGIWSDPPRLLSGGVIWQPWVEFVRENTVFAWLRQTDQFAGLGTFAICVMGIDDGKALAEPINTRRKNKLMYMQPYLEGSVQISAFEEDETSPRFGKPLLYEVTPGEVTVGRTSAQTKLQQRTKFTVHYSRVLHIAEGTMENRVFGHSRLEPVYNVLDDLLKVCGGSAETYWLAANRGMQVDVDREMDLNADDAEALSDEIQEYQHQLRRVIRTRGVKITNLGSDVADPKGVFMVLIALLSSTTGIPQRVLMGAEAGQLASQQDRANWAQRLRERISTYAEPFILRPFIKFLSESNILVIPDDIVYEWPEQFKLNPFERAQTSAQMARSAVNVARAIETAQKCMVDLVSVEESRMIIAPGDRMPIFVGVATGTLPPSIKEVDPQKFVVEPTVSAPLDPEVVQPE